MLQADSTTGLICFFVAEDMLPFRPETWDLMSDHLKFLFFFPLQNNKTKTQTIMLELLYIKKNF